MSALSVDRDAVESKWQANERRLTEIHAMTGLGRPMHGAEIERIEGEQDHAEWQLGFDGPTRAGSRRWWGVT
jgi:hypothetical protein